MTAVIFSDGFGLGLVTLLLAGLYAVSASAKLRDPHGTAGAFDELGIRRAFFVTRLVTLAELLAVLLLVVAPWLGATLSLAMLIAFTVVIVSVIRHGVLVRCACFGAASESPVGWGSVVRNLVLIVVSFWIAVSS